MDDKELKMMLNTIIEEIGKVSDRMNEGFRKNEEAHESIQHELNALKFDHESVSLLLKKIDELEKRVADLESKIA